MIGGRDPFAGVVDPWTDDAEDLAGGMRPSVARLLAARPALLDALAWAAAHRAHGASEEGVASAMAAHLRYHPARAPGDAERAAEALRVDLAGGARGR